MLRCPKGTVVSDLFKSCRTLQQVRVEKTSESEPIDDPSKCQDVVESRLGRWPVISRDDTCLRSLWQPAKRWRELNTGACTERVNLSTDVKGNDKCVEA